MDDPELALEKAIDRLDSESSDSEVNAGEARSVVESTEMGSGNGIYNKEQQYNMIGYNNSSRHLRMPPCRNHLNSLQTSVSGSEDNSSIASFDSDLGPKSAVYCQQARASNPAPRLTVSDTEGSSRHRSKRHAHHHDAYLTENKTVSREEFYVRVRERLLAVGKDREAMTLRARDMMRQRGNMTYEEIMATEWYSLPEARKYLDTDSDIPVSQSRKLHPSSTQHQLSPPEVRSPDSTPNLVQPNSQMRDVQEAMKEWRISQEAQRKRRSNRHTSACSSVFTSDSGVGGDTWAANDQPPSADLHEMATPSGNDRLHTYLQRQNFIASRLPERERNAQAAAIALISNSPHSDSLNPLPVQQQYHHHRDTERRRQHNVGHYSSGDDSSSVFTITSQSSTSDLFIPRRSQHHPLYPADSADDQQHSSRSRRTLITPKRSSHIKNTHTPSPLAHEQQQQQQQQQLPPQPNPMPAPRTDTLVMYTLDELPTPFAKRLNGTDLTLKDFIERVFARKGEYRFFFKSFCPDINTEIFEEISDERAVLPLVKGKIEGRVEKIL